MRARRSNRSKRVQRPLAKTSEHGNGAKGHLMMAAVISGTGAHRNSPVWPQVAAPARPQAAEEAASRQAAEEAATRQAAAASQQAPALWASTPQAEVAAAAASAAVTAPTLADWRVQ
jgi:type II secretory pathway component HofQ